MWVENCSLTGLYTHTHTHNGIYNVGYMWSYSVLIVQPVEAFWLAEQCSAGTQAAYRTGLSATTYIQPALT